MSDGIALVRTLGALLTVLGLLAGALWAVRRYNLVLPGSGLVRLDKRLAVIERLSLDPRRSLALIRRDDVEHLVMLSPEGHLVIESNIAGGKPAFLSATGARSLAATVTAAKSHLSAAVVSPVGGQPEPAAPARHAITPAPAAKVAHSFGMLLDRALNRRVVAAPKSAAGKRGGARGRRAGTR